MEKMREEFEKFYSKEFGCREDNPESMFETFCDDGESYEYYRLGVRAAWTTWQAGWEKSRAALCVNLPDSERSVECGDVLYRSDVEQALDAAGIRYV